MTTFEYWSVGLVMDSDSYDKCYQKVNAIVQKFSESSVDKFTIPQFRFGILDQLMSATDNLKRLRKLAQELCAKLISLSSQVMELKRNDLENIMVVNGLSIYEYLKTFKWDPAKYPTHQTIKRIEEVIEKQLTQVEEEMNKLREEYNKAFHDLDAIERLQKGSLLQRNVSLLLEKNDFVLNSQHLITLLVAVPKARYKLWLNTYERIDREVVPRSTVLVIEDEEYGLFTVTLFKRHQGVFKERAAELRFIVKDFIYNEEQIEKEKIQYFELKWKKKKIRDPLIKWLKANFSETMIALTHLEVMRMAVECVLRYGLSEKFFAVFITVNKANASKLRQLLIKEYTYLDESINTIENASLMASDELPFVCFKVRGEFSEFK